jgi:cytochrome c oxidase assembly protein Cox11
MVDYQRISPYGKSKDLRTIILSYTSFTISIHKIMKKGEVLE